MVNVLIRVLHFDHINIDLHAIGDLFPVPKNSMDQEAAGMHAQTVVRYKR